jgi:GxxExxY protein
VLRGIRYERQYPLTLRYKGIDLDCGYVLDMLVEDVVVVELKTVERLLPIHDAQLLTYLKLSNAPVGLLMNFKESTLVRGLKRMANNLSENSAPWRLCGSIK